MRRLLRRRMFFVLGIVAGLVGAWQVRRRRQARFDLEWEAEISGAVEEGRAAGTLSQ